MESFFSRYKNSLTLMLVVLAQVVLLAMQVRRPAPGMQDGHNIRLWRYWVASVVTPPEKVAHEIGLKVRGVWSNYIYLRNLRRQNESLQDENTRLRLEQASLAEDAREGQRLREMLDFRAAYIDTTVPAQVIGTSGTDQAHVIYIDKGSKDGIRPQMAVITPDGVVGKVKNVFPGTSQVLLISDQTSGAGVMLQTTRIRGVLKGSVSGRPQIVNISPDERIQPGEAVLTSGGDQVYPRGLPVGVVEKVVPDPDTSYVNVVVKPNANLQKLEEVMVITQVSDKMPFGQEKDMMQSEVDAYAEKERAADVLSEKLPSLRDAETTESKPAGGDSGDASRDAAATTAGSGDPARPMRPPQPLHPDRYTPGAAPAASELTPGVGPPVKYPSSIGSEAAAAKATKTAGAGGGIAAGTDSSAAAGAAVPKSRFPAKPAAATPVAANAAGGDGSANGATASTKSNQGLVATAGSGVSGGTSSGTGAAKTAARPAGSEFVLPLRPAYPGAGGGASGGAGVAVSGAASPTAGGSMAARTSRQTTETAATTGDGSSRSGSAGETRVGAGNARAAGGSSSRSIDASSDSGGILTPAGMGSIVSTPRLRAATSPGGATSAGAASTTTAKPATPRPATTGTGTGNASGSGTPRPQTVKPSGGTTQPPAPKPQNPSKPQAPPPGGF